MDSEFSRSDFSFHLSHGCKMMMIGPNADIKLNLLKCGYNSLYIQIHIDQSILYIPSFLLLNPLILSSAIHPIFSILYIDANIYDETFPHPCLYVDVCALGSSRWWWCFLFSIQHLSKEKSNFVRCQRKAIFHFHSDRPVCFSYFLLYIFYIYL